MYVYLQIFFLWLSHHIKYLKVSPFRLLEILRSTYLRSHNQLISLFSRVPLLTRLNIWS